ncbi:lignin expressed protein 9 [Heterobasidion irregulare TC 32-1]|uniref:Lignin expressed protein 9 n=1 Tax=Heterobasidion irregulare (strain TC 32-1) TaxID=747525 RepID=W4K236_HETIT|nr:lignin expressed protein 9 [Heterobasidion irregulare TC 32-1]ETW79878.1 lignin expressed protein 9 [Heterobasidion irregulare TC 32-1]
MRMSSVAASCPSTCKKIVLDQPSRRGKKGESSHRNPRSSVSFLSCRRVLISSIH